MHDAKGRELKVGDRVLLPAVVEQLSTTEDYCNVGIRTENGRRPDGAPERISAINTAVLFRANEGDDNADVLVAPAAKIDPAAPFGA